MTKTTKGCLWIGLPMLALPLILGAWAFLSFLIASMLAAGEPAPGAENIVRIVNLVLGFLGIISVIMLPIGLIVGIIILVKKDETMPPTEPPLQPPIEPPMQPPTMSQPM